jgi:predicted dehydrogenase
MRIGVASLEHVHAETYVRLLHAWDGIELFVADPVGSAVEEGRRATRERIASLGVNILDSFDDLLAAELDGIIVCTPNSLHREIVERSAAAGVHVLCEKPLATVVDDAQAMVDACDRAGVGLMLAYPVRFSPGMRELKAAIDRGEIGRIIAFDGANVARIPVGDRAWFGSAELAGGGAMMDHTVHLADILLHLTGEPVTSVYAQSNRIAHAGDVEVETGAIVTLEFASGVVAVIDASWSLPDSNPTWGGLTLRAIGESGELSIDAFGDALRGHSEEGARSVWRSYGVDSNRLMLAEFLDSIREGRPPVPDGHDGLQTLQIVLAAYRSSAEGRPVPVDNR